MENNIQAVWPLWKKIGLRFLSIFFLSLATPWTWFNAIPGVYELTKYYYQAQNWVVNQLNKWIFHIREELVPMAGSGDSSFGWAELCTILFLATVGTLLWSLLDRKRTNYNKIVPWLGNLVRYYVALFCFVYGIAKLFALQMPFPNLSQLATPLGDFYPMRFSWMFMGYSAPYQIFSGIMETLVGILLLNRRTVTFGALLGFGVFANVVMMNLSFDIPVKIFATELLVSCLFLILLDWKRIFNFFVFNKSTQPNKIYTINLSKKWHNVARIVWKIGFVILFIFIPLNRSWDYYKERSNKKDLKPIKSGVYMVSKFVKNRDTLEVLNNDTTVWKDFIFDKGGVGSVGTLDTLFRQRYGRGYFAFEPDTINNTISFRKRTSDSTEIFNMKYEIPKQDRINLWTQIRKDTLYLELQRSHKQFPLAEKQFNWITEAIK